jgi:WD40 repeat protein
LKLRDTLNWIHSVYRHHHLSILYTGASKDKTQNIGQRNAINYLSLHDNKILRQFRGHSGEVVNISMSPVNDHFLSSSTDRTVRLWDLQQAGSLALMDPPKSGNGISIDSNGTPLTVFDSTGLVFGITVPLDANAGHVSDCTSTFITFFHTRHTYMLILLDTSSVDSSL